MSESDVPLGPKTIAACAGSLVTSFVVNPFDVVRVRMQQAAAIATFDASNCFWEPAIECGCKPQSSVVSSSALAGVKPSTLANNCGKLAESVTTSGTFLSILRSEGTSALWRGLSLQLIQSLPSNVVYFITYEHLRDKMSFQQPFLTPLLAGGFSRALSSTCVSPLELFKTRLQSVSGPQAFQLTLESLKKMVKHGGIRSLWSGLGLTLYRDVPFSSIYWAVVESVRSTMPRKHESASQALYQSFVAGTVGGAIAALVTTPFDVGKTRRQLGGPQSSSAHMKMLPLMINIMKKEGWRALFVGVVPRVLKVAPACAIMISSYEVGKVVFTDLAN